MGNPVDTLYVATRKGLFRLERRDGWQITGRSFVGDPVTMILDDAADGTLYAALNLGHFGVKLHRSADRGETWEEVTAPTFPGNADDDDAPSVKQVWELVSTGKGPGSLWAGTIPGALFRSDDGGSSWSLCQSLWDRPERSNWFGGGYDDPGIHSICVHPNNPDNIVVGVSCGGAWVTDDGGATWETRTAGMFAAYMPPERKDDPSIQDPHRIARCPANPDILWSQHHNGVFHSTDEGRSWKHIDTVLPSDFGFGVVVHPDDGDQAWLAPAVKDECRVPVDGRVVVAHTRNGGASFVVQREGLPQEDAYDLVFRHALDIDASGSRLAMGSTTGSLWLTEDGGTRWQTVSRHLPPIYQVQFATSL
ncbi:MAG: exo-alpha-sialidase [Acidobacteriota bacterium]|nr:exo-alpha-sialidase [Acidobacteriota bacterium]MDH3785668.1 exo-alpha-sialidase [Acidobacteriota bacterium]